MIAIYKQLRKAAPRCRTVNTPLHRLLGGRPVTYSGHNSPALAYLQVRGKKTTSAFKLDGQDLIPLDAIALQDGLEHVDAAGGIVVEAGKKTRTRKSKGSPGGDEITGLPQGLIALDALPLEENIPSYPTVVLQARNNMRKFENCVLLTRVGGFYELYFEHADEFAPLLNLKVAQKKPGAKATWEPVSMVILHCHVTNGRC